MIDVEIRSKFDCTGCHACFSICEQDSVYMVYDFEGFYYPKVIKEKCTSCKKCIEICPIINKNIVVNEPVAYACINKDEAIRLDSSSGGIFTLIAEQIIESGGVVFGAAFNKSFEVEHSYAEAKGELKKFRGSKYVQSRIGDTYKLAKEYLKSGRTVLFTGTPCQIGGLKSYLKQPYDDLFCVDIICHGVPSPKVWEKYLFYRENHAQSKVKSIAFRQKDKGWKKFSVSFLFRNNTHYQQTCFEDLYMVAFLKDICLRPSCYSCKFKSLHRESDITLADFWGIQNILPDMDDDKGTSLIFINSEYGNEMFRKINNNTIYKKVDINEAIIKNPQAVIPASCHDKRRLFFKALNKHPFDILVQKYCSDKPSFSIRLKRQLKSILRITLKTIGLLDISKKILKKNSQ